MAVAKKRLGRDDPAGIILWVHGDDGPHHIDNVEPRQVLQMIASARVPGVIVSLAPNGPPIVEPYDAAGASPDYP